MSVEIYKIHYICENYGISQTEIHEWIQMEIIHPFDSSELLFDKEDLDRIRLICELKSQCDPNIHSLEVILHLIDQLNYLQKKL
jgi:DNA-binding transcriptional MerR regulator